MARNTLHTPEEPRGPVTAIPVGQAGSLGGLGGLAGLAGSEAGEAVRAFNAANRQHEDLWSRIQHAVDAVRHGREEAQEAAAEADDTHAAHQAIQAENPERRAPRPRQLMLAGVTVALDAVACDFAAQAIGNGQLETLAWTALFLAVLAGGEFALDHCHRERHRKLWRMIAGGLAGFTVGLGVLRFTYLATVGTDSPLAALVGAGLFTVATMVFVSAGYWALRGSETSAAAKARRRARKAANQESAANDRVTRCLAQRDRLADAYLVRIKAVLLQTHPAGDLPRLEAQVRAHLLGEEL
jgi:hypothetical protein